MYNITWFWGTIDALPWLPMAFIVLVGLGTGNFSGYGPIFSEIFPTRIQNSAMGVAFNLSRGAQFSTPVIITWVTTLPLAQGHGLGAVRLGSRGGQAWGGTHRTCLGSDLSPRRPSLRGPVYRAVLPLVKARRAIVLGVFHGWRKFDGRNVLAFDPYRAWRSPDREVPVSPLREELLARLPEGEAIHSAAMYDLEHSVEAIVYWLKHQYPGVEIVPILVSTMDFKRMETVAADLAAALDSTLKTRGWVLGQDMDVVISSDAVHYGPDFKFTPHGDGGVEAYTKACATDRALLTGPLSGVMTAAKTRQVFETCHERGGPPGRFASSASPSCSPRGLRAKPGHRVFCDPKDPGQYRLTWCGRFNVPFGLLLLEKLASAQGKDLIGSPLAYATSVGSPQLPAKTPGLGVTAPSNLYHFVGYPAAAYTTRIRE